jgi:hypothetical protein
MSARLKHTCCLRSIQSVERNTVQRMGKENVPRYECSGDGFECTECGKNACRECLEELVYTLPKELHKTDPWCVAILEYIEDGTYPENYVGHCCEHKKAWEKMVKEPPPNHTRYDGHLYLPEFSLLIDSPFDCVDVHGFGGKKKLAPVWHCVVSHKAAEAYHSNDVVVPLFENDNGRILQLEVPSPYDTNENIKVCIVTAFNFAASPSQVLSQCC